jgi:hypothetical protein
MLRRRCPRDFAAAHRIVNVEATPIFQFAVFYTDDLEIFPGANMRLGGRVHTNADMYMGSNGTLTVDSNYCRAIGGIYRNRKDDPAASPERLRQQLHRRLGRQRRRRLLGQHGLAPAGDRARWTCGPSPTATPAGPGTP